MPRAVLLDLYGTLAEPNWAALTPARDALAEHVGISVEAARLAWAATHPKRMRGEHGSLESDIAAVFAAASNGDGSVDEGILRELAERERANWRRDVRLYPDVLPTLRRLRDAGVRLALVTNASAEAACVIPQLGLDPFVELVLVSCEARVLKPELLERALSQLAVPASEAILVDDDPEQVAAAMRLGMEAVLVRATPHIERGASERMQARVVTDLTELPAVVLGAEPTPRR